jgi:hypothetical protein
MAVGKLTCVFRKDAATAHIYWCLGCYSVLHNETKDYEVSGRHAIDKVENLLKKDYNITHGLL